MTTGATYQFSENGLFNRVVCFYIPSDGFLEGAADYFMDMHKYKNMKGGFAERFFRANQYAEFTLNHESHDDTEYRYSLDGKGYLIVQKRVAFSEKWNCVYQGLWYEFVNKYLPNSEKLFTFKLLEYSEEILVMTLKEAKDLVMKNQTDAEEAHEKYLEGDNNFFGSEARLTEQAQFIQARINQILEENPTLNHLDYDNYSLSKLPIKS